jgi:hypothetical protein
MGRKKKYITEQEKRDAQNKWVKEYYERNKERLNKTSMEKYYEKRNSVQDNKPN